MKTYGFILCLLFGAAAGFAEPLTLEQAIETALENNPALSAVRWQTVAAESAEAAARARRLPAATLRGSYEYTTEDQRLMQATYNGEPGVFGSDLFAADVVVRLPIFTGGRIQSEIAAAELLRQAAEGGLGRDRETVAFNVTSLFCNMLAQREVIASVESALKAMEAQRNNIADQVEVQKAARVDLLRADVRLAELKEKLTRERSTVTIQGWTLAALLGQQSGTVPEINGSLIPVAPQECPDSSDCLRTALANRNDYAAARSRAAAQSERVNAARAAYWPVLSAQASYGERWLSGSSEDIGRAGLVAEIPLFEGGAIRARVGEQSALQQAAQEQLRGLELQIRTDVETALAETASARERVETTSKAVDQARESFRIISEKYELGKGIIVDVLDAQAALVQAETSYARALADLAVSDARRKLATGMMLQ
jgi:outer membrane protein TolC